jgi:hypothetical protein
MKTIVWTRDMIERFTHIVAHMLEDEKPMDTVFVFDGHQFVLGYAKYVCQYLNRQTPTAPSGPEPRRSYERSKGGR